MSLIILQYPNVGTLRKKNYTDEVNLYNVEPTLMLSLDSHTSVCVSIGNVIIPYNKHIWLRMQAVLFPLSRLHSSGQSRKYPTAADKKADLGSFLTTWGCVNANTQTHTPLITFIHSRTKKTDTEKLQLPVSNTGT